MDEPCFYRVSVKGIAINPDGKFLLAKESNGMWDMLGGGLEHGEDPISCLKREIKEETGLIITSVTTSPLYFLAGQRYQHKTYVANAVYKVTFKNLDFTPSDECQELRFFSVEEARQLKVYPTISRLLEVYNPELHI